MTPTFRQERLAACAVLALALPGAARAAAPRELREAMARQGDEYAVAYEFVSVGPPPDGGKKWRLGLTVKELREAGWELGVNDDGEFVLNGGGRALVGREGILPLIQQIHTQRLLDAERAEMIKEGDHYEVQNLFFPHDPSPEGMIRIFATARDLRAAGYALRLDHPRFPPVFIDRNGKTLEVGSRGWAGVLTKTWLAHRARSQKFAASTEEKLRRVAAQAGMTGDAESAGSGKDETADGGSWSNAAERRRFQETMAAAKDSSSAAPDPMEDAARPGAAAGATAGMRTAGAMAGSPASSAGPGFAYAPPGLGAAAEGRISSDRKAALVPPLLPPAGAGADDGAGAPRHGSLWSEPRRLLGLGIGPGSGRLGWLWILLLIIAAALARRRRA